MIRYHGQSKKVIHVGIVWYHESKNNTCDITDDILTIESMLYNKY